MEVYLTDATGTILVYRTTENLVVGDVIKVTGKIGSYKGDKQIAQGSKVEKLTVSTIAQATEMADGTEVVLKGTVSSVKSEWNEKYGNMEVYLKDETGELLLYRITNKVAANDKVVVFGKMGSYKGTKQLAQGGSAVVTEAAPAEGGNTEAGAETVDGTKASKTMAELITANNWNNTDTVGQSFTLDSVVSVKIDGGSNSGKAYNGDHIRIYATDTPAGSITISVAEGYELVSVKVSAQTGTYAFLNVAGSTDDVCNKSVPATGSSIVLNSVKNGADGKQVRVTAIEVVYKAK
ncbi:MAG: hypothetical protein E7634_05030 [Ruminococcaceae bacterium]|nr:hypothetical protein [Oscillospiraceae bacterium]